jgi:uncharacterized protein (DUF885 family)
VLGAGTVPLHILEAQVHEYVQSASR